MFWYAAVWVAEKYLPILNFANSRFEWDCGNVILIYPPDIKLSAII